MVQQKIYFNQMICRFTSGIFCVLSHTHTHTLSLSLSLSLSHRERKPKP